MRPPADRAGVSADEQEDILPRVVGQRTHVCGIGNRGAGVAAAVVFGDARIAPRNGEKTRANYLRRRPHEVACIERQTAKSQTELTHIEDGSPWGLKRYSIL